MGTTEKMMDEVENCLAECRHAKATDEIYRNYLRQFFAWLEEKHWTIDTVPVSTVKEWLESHGWSTSTQYNAAAAIRLFIRWGYGGKHPLIRLRVLRIDPGPQRTLNAKELTKLMESQIPENQMGLDAFHRAIRNTAMIAFMVDTGARAAEAVGLTMDRVNFDDREAWLLGKGAKWRRVVFSARTAELLERYMETRKLYVYDGVNEVFVSIHAFQGRKITTGGLRKIFRDMGKKAGITRLSPHCLRRTMATLALRGGASTRQVQIQGGWGSLDLVERYTRVMTADDFAPYSPIQALGR